MGEGTVRDGCRERQWFTDGFEAAITKGCGKIMHYLFAILMFFTSFFLVLLVLVQRGRGGGLAGAFGGMGGQSAFGTKAGDLFTRLTMGVAGFWILLCVASIAVLNSTKDSAFGTAPPDSAFSQPGNDDAGDGDGAGDGGDAGGDAGGGGGAGGGAGGETPAEGGSGDGDAPSGESTDRSSDGESE
ncbi:MAG: preprotein translocase subunit SecG [Pirellulaceae bacterium]